MRVYFKRAGGFAGMPLDVTVDVGTLPPADSQRLRELIDAASFFSLPPKLTAPIPGGDRFQYSVAVETPEQRHTVEIHEAAVPPAVRPLLEWLSSVARARREAGPRAGS